LRKQTTDGLYLSLRHVWHELKIFFKHRKGIRHIKRLATQKHLKLHLGCGPKIKKNWINIDFSPQADITIDMRETLPFQDNSCSIIYSEHFLEHLDYPYPALSFLKECYRILEPGGIFSIGVPDSKWPIAGYTDKNFEDYFQIAKEIWHPKWCQTKMEHLNYHFRQGEDHRFSYDLETLVKALGNAGFQDIKQREFDPELDSSDRQLGTLYIDASKTEKQ